MENFKRQFYTWTTERKKTVIIAFIAAMLLCILMKGMVSVNYDIKEYLPESSPSTVALQTMKAEYEEGVPNTRVMVGIVSIQEAAEYKEKILAVDGVSSVTWLDDSVNLSVPLATIDESLLEQYYMDGNALFQVTVDESKILTAIPEIEKIIGDENHVDGNAASTYFATVSSVKEMKWITVLSVLVVMLILVFTTTSWLEPVLIMLSIGVAVIINAGTHLLFGEVSFVTDSAGSVLLLAVSLDYSVFLIHRYHDCREELENPQEAMVEALCKSTNSILSSGITTIIGFMALVLMRFKLGPDLGWSSAKGIVISLITAFVFLPAMYLALDHLVEKTKHRPLIPDFTKLGKTVCRIMIPIVCVFVLIIGPSFMASNSNQYNYGASKIFGEDTELGRDSIEIEKVFEKKDTYALMLPKGELSKEKALSEELHQLPEITNIVSYVDTVGAEIPASYLDPVTLQRLQSDKHTRMIITTGLGDEGIETFKLIEDIKAIASEYYPGEYLLAGTGPSNYDLMDTITADMMKVNLIAIAAVYLILVIMMRSLLVPALLVLSIETAIWINLSIPYFSDNPVFYIAYLIISAIQLGATVDYAILMADRYRECRQTLDKKASVIETIAFTVPSIMVSGLALVTVGMFLGLLTTHGILAQLGVFLGRGGFTSLLIVTFVLPGLLYMFDRLYINRGKKKMKNNKVIAGILAAVMLFNPAAAFADTASAKEEVIYGNLTHGGDVTKVYAVNIFENSNITDYGDYEQVRNLTTPDKIHLKNGIVTVSASEMPFYYEGTLKSSALPWHIDIGYTLDGISYNGDELAGKSGRLEIDIDITKGNDDFFYDNYALQMTLTMDGNYCRNIQTEDGTIANVGSDKQIVYTILPGNGADIKITADVTDFEMREITINGIKLAMDVNVDTLGLEGEVDRLEESTVLVDDGAARLQSGASELQTGTKELVDGVAKVRDNVSSEAWKSVMSANGLDIEGLKVGNEQAIQELNELLDSRFIGILGNDIKESINLMIKLSNGNIAALDAIETYLDTVNAEMEPLEVGASDLSIGAAQLAEGAGELKSGTTKLKEGTSGIDKKFSDEIDKEKEDIMGSDEVRSFISSKNTAVESVQFVLKTEPIKVVNETAESSEPEAPKSFWQKLIELFR